MQTTRRAFMGGVALASATITSGIGLSFSAASAQGVKRVIFASAGSITGNWDTTSHTTVGQWNAEHFIFNHLTKAPMKAEKPDELLPDLATSWTLIDKHTLEFKLREGVKFHNGQDFGAEDVKATFDYASDPKRPSASLYPGKADITVVDKLTVRINTERYGYPAAAFYYIVSFLPIMSAADIAKSLDTSS